MEKQIIFRDYQEQQAQDHNDLQDFARLSLDHVVFDAVTSVRRFSGFLVQKTAQTEIQIQPGRFYDVFGVIHNQPSVTTQSMLLYLPAIASRIISVCVYGVETETEIEERDYLVDVSTGRTEPRAQAMVTSRDAVIVFTNGAESADPQPPAISPVQVEIARILLDTTQVVSVTMMNANRVVSTGDLDFRTDRLEDFEDRVGKRIDSLANDLADLAARLANMTTRSQFVDVFLDLARLKARTKFPSTAALYGSDFFLGFDESDYTNSKSLGYDALVEMGCRFPVQNANLFELQLFSANDGNAALANGVLLPAHTDVLRISTGAYASEIGLAQYTYQTTEMKQGYMSRSRLRYGGSYMKCSNSVQWNTAEGQASGAENLYDFTESGFASASNFYNDSASFGFWHEVVTFDRWWYDTWKEPYMYAVTIPHTIPGALIAQSWTQSNDTWATRVGIYVTSKAANEDIHIAICEVTTGVPDLDKLNMKTSFSGPNIVLGWNRVTIPYTFLAKGKRYALVVVSNANHKMGMADGTGFLNGTFFYSTDGMYFQGDLTKDLMLEIWGAKFPAASVTIPLTALNLDGGFRNIDILAEMYVPASTALFWELKPSGSGEWLPLAPDTADILGATTAPPLAEFRLRFVGTADMQPAIKLTGSRCKIWRPKQDFRHISTVRTMSPSQDEIHVILILENFDTTPHTCTCFVHITAPNYTAVENPDTTVITTLNAALKRVQKEFVFMIAGGVQPSFIIEIIGHTNTPQNTFHVAERSFYAL